MVAFVSLGGYVVVGGGRRGVYGEVRRCERRRWRMTSSNGTGAAAAAAASSSSEPGMKRKLEVEIARADAPQEKYQLSIGERARTVVHTCRNGTLCTSSLRHGGTPFGSHVDYVLDERGRPIFLLANSAAHTLNLEQSREVSLFCQPLDNYGQSGGRTTLVGDLARVSRLDLEDLVDTFVDCHPHARDALKYTENFHFYRMEVKDVYFVGGYGVAATWVDVEQYTLAEADPLAFDAAKLIDRLNASTNGEVTRLCTVFCGMKNEFDAKVVSLDRLGLDVRITSPDDGTLEFRLCFREVIANSFEAQSSLVKLLQEAWERENGFEEEWRDAPPLDVVKYFSRSPVADKYADV